MGRIQAFMNTGRKNLEILDLRLGEVKQCTYAKSGVKSLFREL